VPLVEITDGPVPPRLRLVTLEQFDGVAWTSTGNYRRAGTQLPPASADVRPPAVEQVTLDLTLPNPDLLGWVPSPGRVVALSTSGLGVDVGTGDVAVPQGVRLPRRLRVTAELPVVGADDLLAATAVPAERPVPAAVSEVAPGLVELVEAARRPVGGGGQSDFAVLAALEAALRDPTRFRVDTGAAPPVGHGLLQVGRALADGSGTAEQYASAFAVGARLLGAQSRLVVGYTIPEGPGGASRVGTRDLDVWPEVGFAGLGWVAFDPVPGAGRAVPPPEQAGGGAPTTSASASPSPSGAAAGQQGPADTGADGDTGTGTALAVAVAGALLLLLAPWPVKRVRRARRRRASPGEAVAGAWRELGDRLTERGQRPTPTMTLADLVCALSNRLGREDARTAAGELAGVAGAARFGAEPSTTADADRAWRALTRIERDLGAGERWPVRVRTALDVRPALRR
jgi:transglutaminase-like putative cysteine protease